MLEVAWLTCSLQQVPQHDEWLSPSERARLAGLRVPKRRDDWRLGRWTARAALRAAWPRLCDGAEPPATLEIVVAEDGAPELGDGCRPGPAFSISHSGGVALCATAAPASRVGCDIEQVEERAAAFVRDFFAPAEQRAVQSAPAERRALVANLIWSAKESALKARRTGLRADTRTVQVEWPEPEPDAPWSPLVVTPAGDVPLHGWWRASRGAVLTLVTAPPSAMPIGLSEPIPI